MKGVSGLIKIWLSFAIFLILFGANFFIKTSLGLTATMWFISEAGIFILAVVMLIKNGLPDKSRIMISLLLALPMFLAYQGVSFSSINVFTITLICAMAAFSIFERHQNNALKFLKSTKLKDIIISVGIGLVIGSLLGIVNVQLFQAKVEIRINLACFLTALSPAICEEIVYRTFIFAFCLYMLRGEIKSRGHRFTCYFMMVIPHVMIHTPDAFVSYGVVSGLINILILALLFGLPSALLQKKRDVTAAMFAHGIVDVIRFCCFGLPF